MRVKKGTNNVNMTDVALRAGVSQSTVSRVISRNPAISSKTREQVMGALRELGYKSELRNLFSSEINETKTLDLVMCPLPEQKDPFALEYFSMLSQGANSAVENTDFQILPTTLPANCMELPARLGKHGVILIGYPSKPLRDQLRQKQIPYVIASGDLDGAEDEDMIAPNNFEAGALGGEYLLKRGCKRIGFIIASYNLNRFCGFQYALMKQGLTVRPSDLRIMENTEMSCFIECIHLWIAEKDLPDALVIGYGESADAVETILKLHKIRVPEDIILMDFDHVSGKTKRPYLNTRPIDTGYRAVVRLMEKMRNPADAPYWTIVPMTLEGI